MKNRRLAHSSDPQRLAAEVPPSLLVLGRDAEVRRFLRACLQRWYQVAEAAAGEVAVQHLTHCPPRALIAGRVTARDEEALRSALPETESPPVLKLWARRPPVGWADAALRHPFTQADLQRAVDQLVCEAASDDEEEKDPPGLDDVQLRANVRS